MTEIKLDGGLKIRTFQPPAGFDPMTASQADLLKFGFPARPDAGPHLERYKRVFSALKNKFHYIPPTFRLNPEKIHGPRKLHKAEGTESSTNWSGAVVYASAGQSFKWVEGDWVVPNVNAPTQNQWYYCASWIGIDGDGSGDVCQAGVECEVYQSGASVTRHIYPWWEWFPNYEVQINNFPVSAGDMLTMLICSQNGAGSTSATFFVTNRTSGASTSMAFNAPSGTSLTGNCAEWIVEAPTVGGSQSAIADYGEVFFSVCEAVTTDGTAYYGGNGNNINMTAGGSTVSQGNLITPTVVQCYYSGSIP
jgi:hypothetical protein